MRLKNGSDDVLVIEPGEEVEVGRHAMRLDARREVRSIEVERFVDYEPPAYGAHGYGDVAPAPTAPPIERVAYDVEIETPDGLRCPWVDDASEATTASGRCDADPFDSWRALKNHHWRAHGEHLAEPGTIRCPWPECHRAFGTLEGLKRHHAIAHDVRFDDAYPDFDAPRFVCPAAGCERLVKGTHGLGIHWGKSHEGDPPRVILLEPE